MNRIPALLCTAVDLKKALDNAAEYLTPIGIYHTKAPEWRRENDGDEDDDGDSSLGEDAVARQAMEDLAELQSTATVASGNIEDLSCDLTITREGCEFDGDISAFGSKLETATPDTTERLRRWYEAGAVSGYGDVKAQETKVDPSVRDAREITASEFHAPRSSSRRVRAESYKIHLYGPGGKFDPHRDTPETDLVGTFLVGLGDASKTDEHWKSGALALGIKRGGQWIRHVAHLGSWVAFYPDVDHAVREISSGYRAVIALKTFREHLDTPEVPAEVTSRKMREVLMRLQTPYGILLRHHYSAGTAELNGSDAALCCCTRDRRGREATAGVNSVDCDERCLRGV